MKMTFNALAISLTLATLLPEGFAQEKAERQKQILRDLCTLNIYMSGQQSYANQAWPAIEKLLSKDNSLFPDGSQPRSSYLARVRALAKIKIASDYVDEFSELFSDLLSNDTTHYSNMELCTFDKVATPAWRQHYVDRPTFNELFPKLEQKFGAIDGKTRDRVSEQSESVISDYLKMAIQRNTPLLHELSLHGSEIMDGYLNNGFKYDSDDEKSIVFNPELFSTDGQKWVERMGSVKSRKMNPLYWEGDFFTGLAYPITAKIWDLCAAPLPEVETTFRNALSQIKKGTFQTWWSKKFPAR